MRIQTWTVNYGCLMLAALLASACGGGGGKSATNAPQSPPPVGGQEDNPPPTGKQNSAPTVEGQPGSSVLAGQRYTFQPSAADADGDVLTFSATNLPSWASFDTATGRISGVPTSADIGTYEAISVRVSDGVASTTLGPFAITVTDVASGSATLSWMPPTENSDGTPLMDLVGYEILYGQDADDLNVTVSLTNASLSSYVVENLTSGTWYFAIVAVNARGFTSSLSNLASKTIG